MNTDNDLALNNQNDDFIDMYDILAYLVKEKLSIILIAMLFSLCGIVYSISLPNIYQSKALLAPNIASSTESNALGAYGGIVGLSGINPVSQSSESNFPKALKKIKTLSFFEESILPNIFLPNLMAVKSWDSETNVIVYDNKIYESTNDPLAPQNSGFKKNTPSVQDSYYEFLKHINIDQDLKTFFITVEVKHQSPYIAKKWANLLINEINEFYREKDKLSAERSVEYLYARVSETSLAEIKQTIAALIQKETKTLTLIEADESYVFEFIDPPEAMEKKSEPARAFICIISTIVGLMLGIFFVFLKYFYLQKDRAY